MSVLASKRSESKYNVIVNAINLYDMLADFSQRNFGIKDMNTFVRKKSDRCLTPEENIAKFNFIIHGSTIRIERLAASVTNNLRAAWNLYPVNMDEYFKRRGYQDEAISACEQIIGELQRLAEKLDADINEYEPCIKAIYQEIDKIKRWRQYDNRIKSRLKQGNV